MMNWFKHVTGEFFVLVDAYPALILFVIILMIALALFWLWLKVPAVVSVSKKDEKRVDLFAWIKNVLSSLKAVLGHFVAHLFMNSGDAYKTPLYLQFKVPSHSSPWSAAPTALTQRNTPHYLREMLSQSEDDNWHVLKDMTLVELPIEVSDAQPSVPPGSLKSVLRRISSKRPQRPIDGIVITMPAGMLISDTSPKLLKLIEQMVFGLSLIDSQVPFALPAYFIVNDCETMTGFSAFAQQNWERHEQIFGCSSNIEFGEKYHRSAIRHAFSAIHKDITRNQVEQSAKPAALIQGDQYFLLDREVSKLANGAELVCEKLFGDPSHKNGFCFRGIYFVGNSLDGERNESNADNLFLTDLLQKKIVAEANLAFPTIRGLIGHKQLLGRYKQISTVLILLLFGLGALNLWSLKSQISSVTNTILEFESMGQSGNKGYAQVYHVLDQLSLIDAREFKRIGLPASWFAGVDDNLVQIISDLHLGSVVFPAMECTLGTQFATLLRTPPHFSDHDKSNEFQQLFVDAWLNEIEQFQFKRHAFITLSKPSVNRDTDILQRFSDLIYALYGAKPAAGFFKRSDLYQLAMERLDYAYQTGNRDCPDGSTGVDNLSSRVFWEFVYKNAERFYTQIQKSSLSPVGAVEKIDISGSGRSGNAPALGVQSSGGQELVQTSLWFDYLEQRWLGENKNTNPCREIHQRLSRIKIEWAKGSELPNNTAARSVALFDKANCETPFYRQLLRNRYKLIAKPFVRDASGSVQFSSELLAFRGNHTSLQELSFMSVDTSDLPTKTPEIVVWDRAYLAKALSYYKEYENYAKINFSSVSLPDSDLNNGDDHELQAAITKQLRNSIIYEIEKAKHAESSIHRSISSGVFSADQYVLQRVENFREVDDLFYQIRDVLLRLGFTADSKAWTETTRASALSILQAVDQLAINSRLYRSESPLDASNPHILGALYGLNNANELKAYLNAQNERASYVAYNYAERVVTYLINNRIGLTTTPSLLEQRWRETLLELDKAARKNPDNALVALENQFSKSLQLTLADCQLDYRVKSGEDIFTLAEASLAADIKVFCGRVKATSASEHYTELVHLFNATLQGRYPFVDSTDTGLLAEDASMAAVRNFFSKFDAVSAGLVQEFSEKNEEAKANGQQSKYEAPLLFVNHLKSVSNFLALSVNQSNDVNVGALDVRLAFEVYKKPPFGHNQILSRSFESNAQFAPMPGSNREVTWSYGNPVYMNARLASTSSYRFSGSSSRSATVSDFTMRFNETGTWALLRMLQRYRVSPALRPTVVSPKSIILEFPLPVRRVQSNENVSSIVAPPLVPSAFKIPVGIELYGLNPATQQTELLELPTSFPFLAPIL